MSGRRYELFELSADLLCTCDFDGHILDMNRAWEQVLGYSPEQLSSKILKDLIHPEDFEETVAQTQSLQFGVATIEPVIRMVAANGTVHWIRWIAVPSTDRTRFHAIGREVTRERVMYDIARSIPSLRSGAEVAERMLSEARVLMPGSWTSVALFGEPAAEVVAWEVSAASGGPRHRLLMSTTDYGDLDALAEGRVVEHGELHDGDDVARFVARHFEEGMRSSLKVPILMGDELLGCMHFGSEVPNQYTARHIEDALEVAGQLGVALQQIRLHRALEASEADFRSVASNADGMVILSPEGVVRWANPAADALFDRLEGELQGTFFEWDLTPGERTEIRLPIPETRQSRTLEVAVVSTDWEGAPARLASLRDVTEQRRLEANLRQAQKMAVVGRLAGGVAHDFNNLLTAMMGHVELLRRQLGEDHPSDPSVLAIADAVDRATRVAQQVLAFSRKQVIDPKPMDLHRQIRRIEPLLRQATGEDVELHVSLEEFVPIIVADPIQIEQVVMNLVVNARDAIEGRGTIELTTRVRAVQGDEIWVPKEVTAGTWVVLGVRDTGFGMGSQTLEQIFEPFFTTKEESGLGLGLSTVHDIVRKCGGYMQVQTAPGQGTSFSIWFPPSEEPAAVVGESSTVIETLAMGQEVVLVVDDEPALRGLLEGCLRDAGYDVHIAGDGLEALQRADGLGHLDLLLTDVRMPGLNGRELDTELRKRLTGFDTIYMSGYSEDILSPHGVLDEGVEFIAKPFRLTALLKRVRKVLDA